MDFELVVVFAIFVGEKIILIIFDSSEVDYCAPFGINQIVLFWHLLDFDSILMSGYFYLERSERFLSRVERRALWELLPLRFLRLWLVLFLRLGSSGAYI